MKRTVKILLSLVLIFSLLTSALFIVFNTEHNCSVENCCICAKIEAAFLRNKAKAGRSGTNETMGLPAAGAGNAGPGGLREAVEGMEGTIRPGRQISVGRGLPGGHFVLQRGH